MIREPDPRWRYISGGLSEFGEVEPMTQQKLEHLSEEWAAIVAGICSFGGTELLESARSHFVRAWWDYEMMVTACLRGLQAVEATIRQVLCPTADEKKPLKRLIAKAVQDEALSEEKANFIRSGIDLRNKLSHPRGRSAFTLGMAHSVLRTCHLVVRDVCSSR